VNFLSKGKLVAEKETSRKYALKQGTGCIFKICRNFTYEVMGQRRRLKAVKKKFSSKIKCQFIF
jgi:hypothetical protein